MPIPGLACTSYETRESFGFCTSCGRNLAGGPALHIAPRPGQQTRPAAFQRQDGTVYWSPQEILCPDCATEAGVTARREVEDDDYPDGNDTRGDHDGW